MFQSWSATARRVADAALMDAHRRRCAYVEPVHFLAALFRDPDAGAQRWLRDEARIEFRSPPPELEPFLRGIASGKRFAIYSAVTEEILRRVAMLAAGRERRTSESMDLLYAITRQEGDAAMEFLKNRNVNARRVELAMETGSWPDL